MEKKHSLYWNKPVSFSINLGLAIIPATSQGFCSSRTDQGRVQEGDQGHQVGIQGHAIGLWIFGRFLWVFLQNRLGYIELIKPLTILIPEKSAEWRNNFTLCWNHMTGRAIGSVHDMCFLSMAHCCKSQVVFFQNRFGTPLQQANHVLAWYLSKTPRFPGKIAQPNHQTQHWWLRKSMRFLFVTIGIFNLIMAAPRLKLPVFGSAESGEPVLGSHVTVCKKR